MISLNLIQGLGTPERRRRKHIASAARWNKTNPERRQTINARYYDADRRRAWDLKKNYDITVEEFDQMALAQNFKCAICGIQPTRLCVDHDHALQGRESVRGLLCQNCNAGLGKFKDNSAFLSNAIAYLSRGR